MRHGVNVKPTRGFTLLEVLLAVILFAIGSVAAMEILHRAQAGTSDGDNTLIATHLAARCLEELRNQSYANLDTATCALPSGFSQFSLTKTVTTPDTNLKQVVVTISWTATGGTANVSLQAYRSNV